MMALEPTILPIDERHLLTTIFPVILQIEKQIPIPKIKLNTDTRNAKATAFSFELVVREVDPFRRGAMAEQLRPHGRFIRLVKS